MRIAYLGQMADVATENGISKKILAQMLHWRTAGHEARYFSLVPTTALWSGLESVGAELVARGGLLRRPLRSIELARRIRAWRPDVTLGNMLSRAVAMRPHARLSSTTTIASSSGARRERRRS